MVSASHPSIQLSYQHHGADGSPDSSSTCASTFVNMDSHLCEQPRNDEAMGMFDSSFIATKAQSASQNAPLPTGSQLIVQKNKTEAFVQPTVDTYHEDECDVGPRPFVATLVPGENTEYGLLQLTIYYNKALTHHAVKEFGAAVHLYNHILENIATVTALDNIEPTASNGYFHIAMCAHNNLGQICYSDREEEKASAHFETALLFAQRFHDTCDQHNLDLANILSNWCRVQWMLGELTDNVCDALEEVLRIRSSFLTWDHIDVASAHFNIGMAEYSRQNNEKAMSHLMHYLKVASHRLKINKTADLDPIPGLIYVLLIKNDKNEDKMSQDLVWGLRTLQDKRQDLGPQDTEVASVLNFIGTLLFHQRELDHALLFFQEELRLEEKLVGRDGDDVSVSVTCNNIGRILQELGRYSQAIYYYQRSLQHKFGDEVIDLEGCKGTGRKRTKCYIQDVCDDVDVPAATKNLYSTVWYNLGLIHDKMCAYGDAIRAFQMSLKLRRSMLGKDHADVACLLYNIGVLQMEQQRLTEATNSFREALRIRRVASTGELNDCHVVKTLQKLSSLHKAKGNVAGALEACREVVYILNVSVDFEWTSRNKNMGATLRDIAELHHANGDLDAALQYTAESLRLLQVCRDSSGQSMVELVASVEQEASALLLIGSLLHERCESVQARDAFSAASSLLQKTLAVVGKSATLVPLLEVSEMLAFSDSAPEA